MSLFSLLPHKGGVQMSYVTVDKSVLKDLLVGNSIVASNKKTQLKQDIMENPRAYWTTFFNIEDFETSTKQFTFFKTDGITVSVVMEIIGRPPPQPTVKVSKKRKQPETPTFQTYYDNVIGIDPGLRNTFVGYDNFGNVI